MWRSPNMNAKPRGWWQRGLFDSHVDMLHVNNPSHLNSSSTKRHSTRYTLPFVAQRNYVCAIQEGFWRHNLVSYHSIMTCWRLTYVRRVMGQAGAGKGHVGLDCRRARLSLSQTYS